MDVCTLYNMTETSMPRLFAANPTSTGFCGRLRVDVDARCVDAHEFDVEARNSGEIALRTEQRWMLTQGYRNGAAATARVWRNGRFHTGDDFRTLQDGGYHCVDRLEDGVLRCGENISSHENEVEVFAHIGVCEAAAVALHSTDSEEEEVLVDVAGQWTGPRSGRMAAISRSEDLPLRDSSLGAHRACARQDAAPEGS